MRPPLEQSVKLVGRYDGIGSRTIVFGGDLPKTGGPFFKFTVGNYAFTNPYSANMFSYLFREFGDAGVAVSTVKAFEKALQKTALRKFWDLCQLDWDSIFRLRIGSAFDLKGTIIELVVAALGSKMTKIQLSGSAPEYNPNTPTQNEDEYVYYAIRYWAAFPEKGPAYKILRYNQG